MKHKDEFELSLEECLHLRLCVAVLDGDYAHIVPIPAILTSFRITPSTPPGHQYGLLGGNSDPSLPPLIKEGFLQLVPQTISLPSTFSVCFLTSSAFPSSTLVAALGQQNLLT